MEESEVCIEVWLARPGNTNVGMEHMYTVVVLKDVCSEYSINVAVALLNLRVLRPKYYN
jgi:hypothetical protein